MAQNLPGSQALAQFASDAVNEWSVKLRTLLEGKHLYQRIDVAIDPIKVQAKASMMGGQVALFDQVSDSWGKKRLKAVMAPSYEIQSIAGQQISLTSPILLVTNAKLFCTQCEASEVFSPLWAKDVAEECIGPHSKAMPRLNDHQLFFMAFQCQRCKSDPEGFIVRRNRNRLLLEGRSPIEHVETPRYLPKRESVFFSDAIVAQNAGKKLAGLFYLRTFLEQFAKRMTGKRGRLTGVELMEAYSATLPPAHRDFMPSFREWYEKLSEAIHDAREDDALFESAKSEIDRHFDIRRIFKIVETENETSPIDISVQT